MKTNTERKNEIISKLRNLAELKEERAAIDFEMEKATVLNNNDLYYKVVSNRLAQDTKINRLMGTIKRMIKKLMNDIYGLWSWVDENDFVEIVLTFKRFA
jgi:phosphopantetheine adenylyltransferase